jgi:hypothetical protein
MKPALRFGSWSLWKLPSLFHLMCWLSMPRTAIHLAQPPGGVIALLAGDGDVADAPAASPSIATRVFMAIGGNVQPRGQLIHG